jgi:preprotein translocase subunit SecE
MGRIQRKKTAKTKKKKQQKDGAQAPVTRPADSQEGVKKTPIAAPKKSHQTASVVTGIAKPNFIEAAFQFLREVKVELKKVTWPSRKQTIGSTVVVLVLVLIISLFLGVVDMGLSQLIRVVLQ